MAWLRVYQSLVNHKKTLAAARDLKIPPVHLIGHLVALWLWCIDNAPDGDLSDISPSDIAFIAQWEGEPETFLSALSGNDPTHPRFLENPTEGKRYIHDWYDYSGKLIEQREANKERMRIARAKDKINTINEPCMSTPETRVKLEKSRVEKSREDKSRTTYGVVDIHEKNFGPIGMPSEALQEVFVALSQFDIREVEETYAQARTHNPPLKFPAGWVLSVLEQSAGKAKARDRPGRLPTGEELRKSWGRIAEVSDAIAEEHLRQYEKEHPDEFRDDTTD
jgi:hypothetical protein